MSSIFGGSSSTSADSSPKGKTSCRAVFCFWREKRSSNPYIPHDDVDLNARKDAVMSSVRNELALANAQELINVRGYSSSKHVMWRLTPPKSHKQKTNDKCFAKCVTKPSTSLSSSEEVRMHSTVLGMKIPFRLKPLLLFFFSGFRARSVFFLIDLSIPLLRPVHGCL